MDEREAERRICQEREIRRQVRQLEGACQRLYEFLKKVVKAMQRIPGAHRGELFGTCTHRESVLPAEGGGVGGVSLSLSCAVYGGYLTHLC